MNEKITWGYCKTCSKADYISDDDILTTIGEHTSYPFTNLGGKP